MAQGQILITPITSPTCLRTIEPQRSSPPVPLRLANSDVVQNTIIRAQIKQFGAIGGLRPLAKLSLSSIAALDDVGTPKEPAALPHILQSALSIGALPPAMEEARPGK
jgi:hypothetical protein